MKIRTMIQCALLASLISICAWLAVPVGDIAVTLQTFGVFVALFTLGGRYGTLTILLYLSLGAVGLPVFSGFQGGLGALLGVTGGYLWGFLLTGVVFLLLGDKAPLPAAFLGLAVCYFCGSAWIWHLYAKADVIWILLKCVFPYVLPDLAKIFLACHISKRIKNALK